MLLPPGVEEPLYFRTLNFTTPQTLGGNTGSFMPVTASLGATYALSFQTATPFKLTVQIIFAQQADTVFLALCYPPQTLLKCELHSHARYITSTAL
jgi:hypothetical protein